MLYDFVIPLDYILWQHWLLHWATRLHTLDEARHISLDAENSDARAPSYIASYNFEGFRLVYIFRVSQLLKMRPLYTLWNYFGPKE